MKPSGELVPGEDALPPGVTVLPGAAPHPRVSVVIPSADGRRGGNLPLLIGDLRAQSLRDSEVILAVGIRPQGRAINRGAAAARGDILVVMDDDSRLPDGDVLARLVRVLEADPAVGMAGASLVQPPDANRLQRWAARELPRFSVPVADAVLDSDMPCHGCCAMPRRVFDQVGREREDIVRGLDPDLRRRLRERGYRVVLAPGCAVRHPLPGSAAGLARMFFRNGRGSAYARRHNPARVFDTDEKPAWSGAALARPAWRRAAEFPLRWIANLCRGRFLRSAGDLVYLAGYAWETLAGPRR